MFMKPSLIKRFVNVSRELMLNLTIGRAVSRLLSRKEQLLKYSLALNMKVKKPEKSSRGQRQTLEWRSAGKPVAEARLGEEGWLPSRVPLCTGAKKAEQERPCSDHSGQGGGKRELFSFASAD